MVVGSYKVNRVIREEGDRYHAELHPYVAPNQPGPHMGLPHFNYPLDTQTKLETLVPGEIFDLTLTPKA